jgi:two-component system chemotaxis response regulator CheB
MNQLPGGHDIVVVGASAGGVEALMLLVGGLPPEFAAAVFVVLHLPADSPSALATILRRSGPLPVSQSDDGLPIEPGHIYVARPNRHLVVHRGRMTLDAGPRENSARPSIDVLFRSAARAYGRRVVGVVLSGTLHDGALGLAAIKLRGGVAVVQDPSEALFRGMPDSALKSAQVDFCLPAAEIPAQLVQLTQSAVERVPMNTPDREETTPSLHAADEPDYQASPKLPNAASGLTCPECHGSLWELTEKDGKGFRFECRVGHTYSPDALLREQGEAVEAALWAAVNSLQERAATFRRLQTGARSVKNPGYAERAELTERHAATLLDLLRHLIDDYEVG